MYANHYGAASPPPALSNNPFVDDPTTAHARFPDLNSSNFQSGYPSNGFHNQPQQYPPQYQQYPSHSYGPGSSYQATPQAMSPQGQFASTSYPSSYPAQTYVTAHPPSPHSHLPPFFGVLTDKWPHNRPASAHSNRRPRTRSNCHSNTPSHPATRIPAVATPKRPTPTPHPTTSPNSIRTHNAPNRHRRHTQDRAPLHWVPQASRTPGTRSAPTNPGSNDGIRTAGNSSWAPATRSRRRGPRASSRRRASCSSMAATPIRGCLAPTRRLAITVKSRDGSRYGRFLPLVQRVVCVCAHVGLF